ncbi:methyltransferase [Flavobacterium magnum]|uniref:Methyltransferase n=2 Tax=Flavobacterium magnum TaxID=2162713 RepID=A0A2S0RI39_9FLAO|nr:methyltransferase [Flavobacterium magnum]
MRQILKKILSPFLKKASAVYLKKRRKYTYKDISVWVEPTVFPPFLTISTRILLDFIDGLPQKDLRFLELGCGCGIISILAAKKGARVTATDINEIALTALAQNAAENSVDVEAVFSDLFENLSGREFDCIIINPPYYPKEPQSVAERAWFCGSDFNYFEALFAQLPVFSTAENNIYLILSEDCDLPTIQSIAFKNRMGFDTIKEKKVAGEKNYIFRITRL